MEKQYGLIIPGQQKKVLTRPTPVSEVSKRASIFDESSSDEDENGPPQRKLAKPPLAQPSAMERRIAKNMHAKALAEDATIFQYDEVYDEIESQREMETKKKQNEPKKSKYIERLLVTAERRKLENDLRLERQVQKEREAEGEEFKDKEKFVTAAYRKKLEEMRKLAEEEKREEYLEAIGDVTKQKDLDGFYRHLYEQKVGGKESKDAHADIKYEPIKRTEKTQQKQRVYRKRNTSQQEEEEEEKEEQKVDTELDTTTKHHLENNLDADSDFSIDSSSSDEDEKVDEEKEIKKEKVDNEPAEKVKNSNLEQTDEKKVALNLQALKTSIKTEEEKKPTVENEPKDEEQSDIKPVVKKDKKDIWKKRTVGEIFDAAVQRYFERKAARTG